MPYMIDMGITMALHGQRPAVGPTDRTACADGPQYQHHAYGGHVGAKQQATVQACMHRRPGKANNAGDAATDAADATKTYIKYITLHMCIYVQVYMYMYMVFIQCTAS